MAEAHWQIGDAQLYEGGRRLISPQGTKVLRPQQSTVLQALLENKGRLVSKEMLMKLLWGTHATANDHRLQSLISELRHVLGEHNAIKNISGSGYLWSGSAQRIEPVAEESPVALHQTAVAAPPQPQKTLWGPNDNKPPTICITICITSSTTGEFISDQLKEEILKRCLTPAGAQIPPKC